MPIDYLRRLCRWTICAARVHSVDKSLGKSSGVKKEEWNGVRISRVLTAGLLVAWSGAVQALDWRVDAGGDARWFDWREYVAGDEILNETGPLFSPLVEARVSHGSAFAGLRALWGGGIAHYDGQLQSGAPYQADAVEEIVDAEWQAGWQGERGRIYLGYLQRDWRRFINGSDFVSSAEERYRWKFFTVSSEAQLLPWSSDWSLAVSLGHPLESYQKVYTAHYDDFALEPGDGMYWRLAFPYRRRLDSGELRLEFYYQEQDMERSDSVLVSRNGVPQLTQCFGGPCAFYQPASLRRELGLGLLWRIGGSAARE
jgi:hypothetical protein